MNLPDPYDTDWESCLAAYRAIRGERLKRIRDIIKILDRYEDICIALNNKGGPSNEEMTEMNDRLRVQMILQTMARGDLVSLRHYIELVRVVFKRADRMTYEWVMRNTDAGIPAHVARAVIERALSRGN